jgi:hypothetical protein
VPNADIRHFYARLWLFQGKLACFTTSNWEYAPTAVAEHCAMAGLWSKQAKFAGENDHVGKDYRSGRR